MDGDISNPKLPMMDSEFAAQYADLENYISSTGGVPLGQSHSTLPGNGLLPPAQHYHPLGDIPLVQNTPNIWIGHFEGNPREDFHAPGIPYEQFQILNASQNPPPHPAAPLLTADSASSARLRPSDVASGKAATTKSSSATSGKRNTGRGNTPKKTPPAAAPKASGKGSRAGVANRQEPGVSDDEIELLGEEAKENAGILKTTGLMDEEKRTVVKYITDELRWPMWKVKQTTYFDELVKIFNKRVTSTQIANFWNNQAWAKYKCCRDNLVKHTGGGDPDDPGLMSDSEAEPDLPNLPASVQGRIFFKHKIEGEFLHSTLRKFLHSDLYALIHKSAHADSSVKRKRARDSASVISDDELTLPSTRRKRTKWGNSEEDSDADSPLHDALAFMKKRAKEQKSTARAQLDIAARREQRKQCAFEAQQDLQAWELVLKERKMYLEMMSTGDLQVVDFAKRKLLAME
ncbi:hypothetical protein V8D89_010534 [Ganoderma adspersum]